MGNIIFSFIPFEFLQKIVVPNGQTCLEACLTSTDALIREYSLTWIGSIMDRFFFIVSMAMFGSENMAA